MYNVYMYEQRFILEAAAHMLLLTAGVEATVGPKEHRRTPAGGRYVISGEHARSSIVAIT